MIYSIVLYRGETALFPYACDYIVCNTFIQRTSPLYYLVFISYFYRFGPHFNHLLCFSLITREIWKTSSAVTTLRQKQVRRQGSKLSFRGRSKKNDYCFQHLILFNVFFFVYSKKPMWSCDCFTIWPVYLLSRWRPNPDNKILFFYLSHNMISWDGVWTSQHF